MIGVTRIAQRRREIKGWIHLYIDIEIDLDRYLYGHVFGPLLVTLLFMRWISDEDIPKHKKRNVYLVCLCVCWCMCLFL